MAKRPVDARHVMETEDGQAPRYQWSEESGDYNPMPIATLITIAVALLMILGLWLTRGWRWN